MRFGIVHHSLGHRTPVGEAMQVARERGALLFATRVNPENRDLLTGLRAKYELELITHWHDKFIENAEKQPVEEFDAFCRNLCKPLHIRLIGTCSTHHRWRKDPPLPEQFDRLAAALRRLCPVAAEHGVTLAIENHADYRSGDILSILERVNHPSLRVQLDTGNPFAVAEEPMDAAQRLAPYTVTTHIKDMTIRPLTDHEWVKVLGCPLGDGDVDLPAIARLLASEAPPDLPFMIEVEPPPGSDYRAAFERSVVFVKSQLSPFVTFASGQSAGGMP